MPKYVDVMYRESLKPPSEYPRKLAAHLASRVFAKSARNIADVGAGRGDLSREFAKLGFSVTAIDDANLSTGTIPGVHQVTGEFGGAHFSLPESSFDVVFMKSVIEHMRNPEALLRQAEYLLRPGGQLVVMTPDWVRNKSRFYDDHTHVTPFTRRSLTSILILGGFEDVDVNYFVALPATWSVPILRIASRIMGPFIPASTDTKFLRWSRERQLLGVAVRS